MSKADENGNELMEIEEVAVSDGGAARFAAVDVKSGEERFNVIWQDSGKLMRFDEGENQWKERGQGTAKVLQRKDNTSKYMFVFRREGVGKLAAQHYLVKGMKVTKHKQGEKILVWSAFKDFTDDEEGFPENFVMRLSSKEAADKALAEMMGAIEKSSV
ncbi:putative Ran-binding protein 1 [Leishmania major strain Friedlin]|uniref:Putative Ran-binding protein 1 n=1 Tax=Leishmania major TaxID=5664 RepID=Q4QG06_LEIMA|nr:putative Ran-binding protein 1 [Leishmania major strain Friedlin]CAG9571155.1 Ran-binding_protein_1_-_putative [Leishmania major strain Friedlin]CAJ03151.1 putative Ran-binding protein 1 [Leishmania major strain Friedlin]|eukprot:XP_001681892.1 putative Ran-binding protein 1 [Leishmania major strain Friedlin]